MNLFDKASLILTPNADKVSKISSLKPTNGTGDFTFSRTGNATRVNSAGLIESVATNVPRLNYPSGGGCPSVLLEPARTNILTYSEDFGNAIWAKQNSSVSTNLIASPSGTTTADKLVEDTLTGQHRLDYTTTSTITTNTFSVFAKKAERDIIYLRIGPGAAFFDLTNITTSGVSTGATASIISAGNDWYRCSVTYPNTVANEICRINLCTSGNVLSYTGNGTSGIYIWGAQVEAGSYATSYIPTTTASVTRNLETVTLTGASALIGQSQGTFYIDADFNQLSTTNGIISLGDGGFTNYIMIRNAPSNKLQLEATGGVNILESNVRASGRSRIVARYNSSGVRMWANGVQISTTTTVATPASLSVIRIGSSPFGNELPKSIKEAGIFLSSLTDAECIALSNL